MRNNFDAREKFGFKAEHCFAQVCPENCQEILDFLNAEAERRGVFDLDESEWEEADYITEDIWEKHCNQGLGPAWILPDDSQKYWYAVMEDDEDNDWGYGSFDLDKAKEMVKKFPEGYIAVIEEGDDPICVEEIRE